MIVALIILVLLAGGFFLYKFFTKPAEEPQAEAEETGDTEAQPLRLRTGGEFEGLMVPKEKFSWKALGARLYTR